MEKEIEIPFGAKDSELKGWEYTIPENMEAEIKDGKIIVREKEYEDERIRKWLIDYFAGVNEEIVAKDRAKIIAYLERQKEPHYSPLCKTIKDKIREYIDNHFIADTVVKTDMKSIVKAMEEGVRLGKEEQKPMAWSKEDYHWEGLVQLLRDYQKTIDRNSNNMAYEDVECYIDRIKSLRLQPNTVSVENATKFGNLEYERGVKDGIQHAENHHWKPSKEQMNYLCAVVSEAKRKHNISVSGYPPARILESLYNELKKL